MTAPRVFVVMPFSEEYEDLWELGIREPLTALGCFCARADTFDRPGFVVSQIYEDIQRATLVIAEMSGRNPNVFYEVGYAHALGIPTVLLARSPADLGAFDTAGLRHILHSGKAHLLRSRLTALIPDLLTVETREPVAGELLWAWPSSNHSTPGFDWRADPRRTHGATQIDVRGGQRMSAGPDGQPCISVENTTENWNHVPEWSILTLQSRVSFYRAGDIATVNLLLRANADTEVELLGDGGVRTPSGERRWAQLWPTARTFIRSRLWHNVVLRGVVERTPDEADPGEGGASIYLRFRTAGTLVVRSVKVFRERPSNTGASNGP